jgi:hypothetical protein
VEAEGDPDSIGTLACVADEALSELIDGIEYRVDAAAVRARRDHLRWRPHDEAGADLAAELEAREEAERLVVAAYEETRRRIDAAAQEQREAGPNGREPRRRRLLRLYRRWTSASPPRADLGELGRRRERFGWPRRDAA